MTQGDLTERLLAAEQACAARDSFIAAISRELNNPLSPVLLAVERLRAVLAAGDGARANEAMQLLERATEAFAGRTRLLLDLADLMGGTKRYTPARINLAQAVEDAVERHREHARRAGCALECHLQEDTFVSGDAEALARILDNLLANALRFGAGHPVHVDLRRTSSVTATVSVRDQGPGLTAAAAADALSLFQKPRDPLQPGLGIGLWIAGRFAQALGGNIGVDSAPGQGAHFHVSLPVESPPSVASAAQNLQTRDEPAGS